MYKHATDVYKPVNRATVNDYVDLVAVEQCVSFHLNLCISAIIMLYNKIIGLRKLKLKIKSKK